MTIVNTARGAELLATFLDTQISRLVEAVNAINTSTQPRVARLYALYSAIIEDAISIRLLGENARLNQAYIISRALLERITNFCFLQLCTDPEFADYVDYSLNKAGRRMDRTIEANGQVKGRIALNGGDFVLPPNIVAAIAKFTSERGGEKTRWTNVSLPDRAAVIEAKLVSTGLFMSLLTIYADASEALHGTLYGAAFHLGAYDVPPPNDQVSLNRHRHETLSALYLMAGGSIDTLFSLLTSLEEPNFKSVAQASTDAFKHAAVATGLAVMRSK